MRQLAYHDYDILRGLITHRFFYWTSTNSLSNHNHYHHYVYKTIFYFIFICKKKVREKNVTNFVGTFLDSR